MTVEQALIQIRRRIHNPRRLLSVEKTADDVQALCVVVDNLQCLVDGILTEDYESRLVNRGNRYGEFEDD